MSILINLLPSDIFLMLFALTCSPDKNPGVKGAHERFARLGTIAAILRDSAGRKRCVYATRLGFTLLTGDEGMITSTKTAYRDGGALDTTIRVGDRVWWCVYIPLGQGWITEFLSGPSKEVLVFLTTITSLLQYIVQRMTYKSDLKRIARIVSEAKLAAWGPRMIPVEGKRKVCPFFLGSFMMSNLLYNVR